MAFTNTSNKVVYVCDGVTTQFPFSFYFLDGEHIKVYKYHVSSGTLTELVRGSDYDITYTNGTPPTEGGRIDTIGDPIPSGYKLIIMRQVPLTQEVDYRPNDPFPAETHEQALDKAMMAVQQVQEQVSRAVVQDPTQSEQITMPTPVGGKFLYSPADGQISWSAITATDYPGTIARGNDADKPSNPSAGDVYYAIDTGIMYVCFSNGVWTPYYADTVRLTTDQTIEGTKTFKNNLLIMGDSSISGELAVDLKISGASAQIKLSPDGWLGLRYGDAGDPHLYIHSTGRVGVHESNPDTPFHVYGEAKITDKLFLQNYSTSSNGYTYLPNGFILQWGRVFRGTSDAVVDVVFPLTFPNQVITVITSLDTVGSNTDSRVDAVKDVTTSGFRSVVNWWGTSRDNNLSDRWIAIGY